MRVLSQKNLEAEWNNLIYAPKQLGEMSIDLTVHLILEFGSTQAAIDFGGSEYQDVKNIPISPKIGNDPKYGWWELSEGSYFVHYNEKPPENGITLVFPHERLIRTGCYHPPVLFIPRASSSQRTFLESLLHVGPRGIRIKENARISRAITLLID